MRLCFIDIYSKLSAQIVDFLLLKIRQEVKEILHIYFTILLSIEWNSIRLSGPAHEIVTKTVHKTLPGGGGSQGGRGGGQGWWGSG